MYVISKDKSVMAKVDQLRICRYPVDKDSQLWRDCCELGIGGWVICDNSKGVETFSTYKEAQETMDYIVERLNAGDTVVEL